MFRQIIYYILILIGLAGFIIVFGTVGASDLELINLTRLAIQGGIGVVLITICLIGLTIGGYNNDDTRKR